MHYVPHKSVDNIRTTRWTWILIFNPLLSFKSSLFLDPYNSLFNWYLNHTSCNWTAVVCLSHHQQITRPYSTRSAGEAFSS
ncbi:hypothetical protein SUGI_0382050 [Cryptomeria japonica]|nr:hypothetical protein SUGI_0382050 [Cryptomeria japonica]